MIDLSTVKLRRSPMTLVMRIIVLSTTTNTFVLIIAIISEYMEAFHEAKFLNFVAYDTAASFILLILQFFVAIFLLLKWFTDFYIVTKEYVIHKEGIILSNERRFKLANIESIVHSQTFLGKLFEYADIKIRYPNDEKEITLKSISYPEQFIHLIEESH